MKLRSKYTPAEKIELQMTPMIDMVFQMLAFFVMTFKIVASEGDFNIDMPSNAKRSAVPEDVQESRKLKLTATPTGDLANVQLDTVSFGTSLPALGQHLQKTFGAPGGATADTTLEIEMTPHLKYRYVIEAIDQISGARQNDGTIRPLIQKYKFTPPPAQ